MPLKNGMGQQHYYYQEGGQIKHKDQVQELSIGEKNVLAFFVSLFALPLLLHFMAANFSCHWVHCSHNLFSCFNHEPTVLKLLLVCFWQPELLKLFLFRYFAFSFISLAHLHSGFCSTNNFEWWRKLCFSNQAPSANNQTISFTLSPPTCTNQAASLFYNICFGGFLVELKISSKRNYWLTGYKDFYLGWSAFDLSHFIFSINPNDQPLSRAGHFKNHFDFIKKTLKFVKFKLTAISWPALPLSRAKTTNCFENPRKPLATKQPAGTTTTAVCLSKCRYTGRCSKFATDVCARARARSL